MEEQIKQPENNNIIKVDFQDKKLLMIIIVLICVVGLMCGITFALYMNQRNSSNNEISTKVSVSRYSLSNIASSNTVTSESTVVSTNVNTSVSNDTKYLTYSDDIVSFQYPDGWKVNIASDDIYRQKFSISKSGVSIQVLSAGIGCTSTTYFNPAYPDQLLIAGFDIGAQEAAKKVNGNIKLYHLDLIGNTNDPVIYEAPGVGIGIMSKVDNNFNLYYSGCNFTPLTGSQYRRFVKDLAIEDILISIYELDNNQSSTEEIVSAVETFANSLVFKDKDMVINGVNYTHNEGRFVRFDYPEGADINIPKYESFNNGIAKTSNGTINSFGEIASIQIAKNYGSYTQKVTLGFSGYGDGCDNLIEKDPAVTASVLFRSIGCSPEKPNQAISLPSTSYVEKYNPRFDIYMIAGKVNFTIAGSNFTSVPMVYMKRKLSDSLIGYYNSNEHNSSFVDATSGYIKQYINNGKITQQGTKYFDLDCALANNLSDSEYMKRANQCFDMANTFMNSFEIK